MAIRLPWKSKKKEASFTPLSVSIPFTDSFAQQVLSSFVGINTMLAGAFGCAVPPIDPFLLLAYVEANGYHSAAVYLKKAMIVGKGYDGDPELLAWIENLVTDYGFQVLLSETTLEMEVFGHTHIEVEQGIDAWALYRAPTEYMRVMPPYGDYGLRYMQYFYEAKDTGIVNLFGQTIFDAWRPGMTTGIRQFRYPQIRGSYFYGTPSYASIMSILAMNINIVDYINKLFSQGMMADMLFVAKGTDLSEEFKDNLKHYINHQMKGVNNAHKVGWIEIGSDESFEKIDLNHGIDASFSNLKKDNREEIATAHGLPPRMLGIIASGGIGGAGEVEGQLKIVKLSLIDERQNILETQWRKMFAEMGAPKASTFILKPLDITAGSLDMTTLAAGVAAQIITPQEAHDDWETEKSAKGLVQQLLNLRRALEKGTLQKANG